MIDGIILESRDLGNCAMFDIVAHIVPDSDATPEEFDCYSPEDIAAYDAGEWGFAVLGITALRNGIALGHDYLGACEYGWLGGKFVNPLDNEAINDMVVIAVQDARTALASLIR